MVPPSSQSAGPRTMRREPRLDPEARRPRGPRDQGSPRWRTGAPGRAGWSHDHDTSRGPAGRPGRPPRPGPRRPPRRPGTSIRDLGRLRRTAGDRKVAGVAGGLARHLDIDPVILRVAFVVLVFFGGAGLLLYVACWLLRAPRTAATGARWPSTSAAGPSRWCWSGRSPCCSCSATRGATGSGSAGRWSLAGVVALVLLRGSLSSAPPAPATRPSPRARPPTAPPGGPVDDADYAGVPAARPSRPARRTDGRPPP